MDEEGGRDGSGAAPKDLQPLVLAITLSPTQLSDARRSSDKTKKDETAERRYLYTDERFIRHALPDPTRSRVVARWRMRERMKTVSVALVYCLNIGVDPPDIVKPNPCARLECWTDPLAYPPQKALENIGKALQAQYERWQPRARYKQCLDPTVEDVKKLCLSLRRNAKEERVLFHYNGHGVPKPTNNGELWVFNKNYTQYIPLSLYELQSWIQSPSIFVFDCSAAALVIHWFTQFAEQREKEAASIDKSKLDPAAAAQIPVIQLKDCILLAACAANETLPTNPDLPADLFTSCLTTPIKAALRWYCSQTILSGITFDSIEKVPGRLNDRKTPLGELNWIFTAITDTIAWNVLPADLFQKLFRQDLLVASLFRNFLLAERVMRSVNCTPTSFPKLPPTYQHPMWQAWDMAVDVCLSQLPTGNEPVPEIFRPSPFFTEQLTAFEVWLEFGSEHKRPPEQLPVVLQVLLSQTHRLRALVLLARFLDLGPWAVNLALSVGIFPYVLKLLQSQALELRQVLVFLWARILALDRSCQVDLVKDNGHIYFLNVLASSNVPTDQRILSLFVLSVICSNCRTGQQACLAGPAPGTPPLPSMLSLCLSQLTDPDGMVRKWATLCIGKFWENYEEAKALAVKEKAHERICALLTDQVPEVRAAAVLALAAFFGGADRSEARLNVEINLGLTLFIVVLDASPMVRRELIFALHELVKSQEARFLDVAAEMLADERERAAQLAASTTPKKGAKGKLTSSSQSASNLNAPAAAQGLAARPPDESPASGASSVFGNIWKTLLAMTADPVPELAQLASHAVNRVHAQVSETVKELTQAKQMKKSSSIASFVGLRSSGAFQPSTSPRAPTPLTQPSPAAIRRNISAQDFAPSPAASSVSVSDVPAGPIEIQSSFFEWSCEFFMRPQTKPHEEDETAPAFVERQWRVGRNQAITADAMSIRDAGCKRLDTQVAFLHVHESETSSLLFHPFDPLLIVGDEQGAVSVWALDDGTKLSSFNNTTVPSTAPRITSLTMLNEGDLVPLLLVGSADGIVHVWRGAYQADTLELVTAFRALSDLASPTALSTGLVTDWIPEQRMLLVSGDVKDGVIRVCDLERELHVQNISSHTEATVTSLAHDGPSRLVYAGYSDGAIRTFDARTPCRYTALGSAIVDHKSLFSDFAAQPFLKVAVPKGQHSGLLVAAAVNGDVKLWDVRKAAMVASMPNPGGLAALAVHDYASLIACGLPNQKIRVTTFSGEEISMIRYHDGFLGQRIGPVSCLSFHPHKVLLAAGATDSIVSVYSGTSA